MAPNLPSLKETTGVSAAELTATAAGQNGVIPAIGAWLLIIGIVIVTSAIGTIATVALVALIIPIIVLLVVWYVFQLMADAEFLGVDGRVLFVGLAAVGFAAALLAGSPLIAASLAIVGVAVIIA